MPPHVSGPPEEIFDIVNEHDAVIGQAPRSRIHALDLLHRAVHVFLFNDQGEVFLQQRSWTKDSAPGRWVSACSGHVDTGEDYDTAARRELREELGIDPPEDFHRVLYTDACRETGHEFVWLYAATYDGTFSFDPEEVIGGQWISPEHLNRWIHERPRDFAWSFTYLWDRYQTALVQASA